MKKPFQTRAGSLIVAPILLFPWIADAAQADEGAQVDSLPDCAITILEQRGVDLDSEAFVSGTKEGERELARFHDENVHLRSVSGTAGDGCTYSPDSWFARISDRHAILTMHVIHLAAASID